MSENKVEDAVRWLAYGAMNKRGFTNALASATVEQLREAQSRVMVRSGRHYPHTTRRNLIAARIVELEEKKDE